jgi:hypothetical protein
MSFHINLPFPPSVNDAVHFGRGKGATKMRGYSSPAKQAFTKEAGGMYLMQARHLRNVPGRFVYHIILNEAMRKPLMDGDNRGKYVLDFLQTVGLIDNDKFAQAGSWSWGPLPSEYGCTVSVRAFEREKVA